MKISKLGKLIVGYENKWIALSKDKTRIIASGMSVNKVATQAFKKGEKNPVLMKVPSSSSSHIL